MSEQAIKVGDVVAWVDVPSGALVRHVDFDGDSIYDIRIGNCGWCVNSSDDPDDWGRYRPAGGWPWDICEDVATVTIIALNVPADATAEDLKRLAERFEVREALTTRSC